MTCLQCGEETSNPRFCGRSCAAKYNNRSSPKRSPEGTCADCGEAISASRKRCAKCRARKAAKPAERRLISCEEARAKQQKYLQGRRVKAKAFLGGQCKRCGSVDQLEFDHIEPKEKSYEISAGIAKHIPWAELVLELAKCQLLCRPCHLAKSVAEGSFSKGRKAPTCGESSGYNRGKCRCDACRAWKKASRITS